MKGQEMAEHKVRTTLRPDEEIIVDDAELLDLLRQGLVESGETLPAKPAERKERDK